MLIHSSSRARKPAPRAHDNHQFATATGDMPPLPVRTLWVVGWRGSWPEKVSRPDQLLGKVNPWFSMLDLTYGEGAALVRAARALGYRVANEGWLNMIEHEEDAQ